ncbi:MAG TPA: hypothetical protein VLT60_04235 [Usitatibacter sp.]|nr:hypothetical protein [Usitatibacter sp.]
MRIAAAALTLAGLLGGAAFAQVAGDSYVEPSTGFSFPEQIGRFHRLSVKEYPDKRLGVKIGYEGPAHAEVFVFDMGSKDIPTGIDSDAVRKAFADSENALGRVLTRPPASDGRKFADSTPTIENEGRVARLKVAVYKWTFTLSDGKGGPMATYLLMTGVKGKILKLLFTAPAPDPMALQADLKELILGFMEANPKQRASFLVEKAAPAKKAPDAQAQ